LRAPKPITALRGAVVLMVLWQVAATALVSVDYYDGYEAMQNARYWLGDATSYRPARWPFTAIVALPSEWLRPTLSLHPLDPRVDHVASGVLHAGTLVAVALMLSRRCGATWATVAAFIAAIPTYVYFSYAPFLSNDIAPGALLLAMVITCEDFLEPRGAPRARTFLTLVGLGATAALIKPSLGVFWLSILCAAGATALSLPSAERRPRLARVTMLLAGASLSGALYWIVCGVALPAELGHTFWIRPFHQLQTLAGSISAEQPPAWLYLRNLPAYGVAAGLGIIPGLVLSWRAGSVGRLAALTWLGCLVVMQLYVQREVRYLAFLAPTTALLLVPRSSGSRDEEAARSPAQRSSWCRSCRSFRSRHSTRPRRSPRPHTVSTSWPRWSNRWGSVRHANDRSRSWVAA